jgi:hypothetical protein
MSFSNAGKSAVPSNHARHGGGHATYFSLLVIPD